MTRLSSEPAVAAGEARGMEPPHVALETLHTYPPPTKPLKAPEPGQTPTFGVALAGGRLVETPIDRAASEWRLGGVCVKERALTPRRSRK